MDIGNVSESDRGFNVSTFTRDLIELYCYQKHLTLSKL